MCQEDEYSKELEIIAGAAAYFQVAYKRIIDVVPMCIENEFLVGLGVALENGLDKSLGLVAKPAIEIEKVCAEYVEEEPALQQERKKLEETKKILIKALKITSEI
jgi:hypothetical protein